MIGIAFTQQVDKGHIARSEFELCSTSATTCELKNLGKPMALLFYLLKSDAAL